ncbi:MAG: sodium-translocating pyrophosphatase [Bacteroidia bacterium]|nr:sodium-translocating pyrophosphatase [Bacteroidia bacterium]MDW8088178.1 sodium-translocating pyrophosphatase [Bacteroidia bacterium]
MPQVLWVPLALAGLGIVFLLWRQAGIRRYPAGEARMQAIASYIARGALAFLKAEWRILAIFALIVGGILAYLGTLEGSTGKVQSHPLIGVAFLVGAFTSALAGYIGMSIATQANVRTTEAARSSLARAFRIAFDGGSVMGIGVGSLAVLGLGGLFALFFFHFAGGDPLSPELRRTIEVVTGFSLGAESIALFARVGGGIYTKAADVGADLVGKIEAGIPEDDPRNPAVIADNVGDNVGDIAGMGADLFGSYVATILATMVLGAEMVSSAGSLGPVVLPLLLAGTGLFFSIVASFFVRVRADAGAQQVQNALNLGNWGAILLTVGASYFLVGWLLPTGAELRGEKVTPIGIFGAVAIGLMVGAFMSWVTEYYTGLGRRPVRTIVHRSLTGHATNILGGLAVGMESTALPAIVMAGGIIGAYALAGLYGVAIAATGMMSTTAMQLSIDAFGPIADNAGGIAEMSGLPAEVRQKTDILDAVGNTTAAMGKGFAIASAALTALALFAAYVGVAGITGINIYKAPVLGGLLIGAMVPFLFSSLAISAVGRAAMDMVQEVRRQFREIPGLMEGRAEPQYERCVEISTNAALREMILPGALALVIPAVVGLTLGAEVLGGYMAGVTITGVLLGLFQSNAGGAWDNAKKSFEKGVTIEGQTYYKKSEPHKAAVTGDTVGDPLKDTSGPSMNILVKLTGIVALILAPYLKP